MKNLLGFILVAGSVAATYYFYEWLKHNNEPIRDKNKKTRKNKQMETEKVG